MGCKGVGGKFTMGDEELGSRVRVKPTREVRQGEVIAAQAVLHTRGQRNILQGDRQGQLEALAQGVSGGRS